MAYRALYREYRPSRFSEVIGQEHITTTLKNQVASGRLAHAYLFCGTRGTGKTTSARILARAVNCLAPEDGEPCGKCEACLAAGQESNGDIIEIDAASNNSVDDVRSLIGKAQFAPIQLSRRVFIIDEVHMLSGAAFNALLKTLEEPPAHVLFILATTEPQKLPATIISRCQRFDFHRLSVKDIVSTLKDVLQKAGAKVSDDGLLIIARASDGGMRDALSLTDQCLSFCGDDVSTKDVYDVLGSMEEGFLFDMADALLKSDPAAALTMLSGIVRGGRDLSVFCGDLAAHFRALLLTKTCGVCTDLLDCTKDTMDRYLLQAKDASQARLLLATELLLRAQGDMRYLSVPRTLLESTLVRICRPEDAHTLADLEARVDRLEASAARPAASAPQPARPAPPVMPDAAAHADGEDYLPPPPPEESGAPWEPEPAPKPVFPQEAAPAPRPTPVSKPAPAPVRQPAAPVPAGDAATLWSRVLQAVQKRNIMVHMMAKNGVAQNLSDNTLTVGFSEADEMQFNSVSAAINQTLLQSVTEELAPGTRLLFVRTRMEPVSDEAAAKAKALFGEQLIIE